MIPDARNAAISVVIPTFNRAGLVERALESVLAQSLAADEIVVVDDGSTDETRARLGAWEPGVRVMTQANSGASVARNTGVSGASCPWIAFLDSDDIWDSGHLERASRAIRETRGKAALYFADTIRSDPEGRESLFALCGLELDSEPVLLEDATAWAMLPQQPMMLQSSVVSRVAFLGAGGLLPDLTVREDTLLFMLLALGGPACAVPGIGAIMSADAASERLTHDVSPATERYWLDTEALYEQCLTLRPSLARGHQRELHRRLAVARIVLARAALTDGRHRAASCKLIHAVRTAPGFTAQRIGSKITRDAMRTLRQLGSPSTQPPD